MNDADLPMHDPVIAHVAAWIEAEARREAMVREWQRLEHAVMLKCRSTGLDFAYACRSGLAEARMMRVLKKRFNAADRKLEKAAGRVSGMQCATPAGALAKVKLGLCVQGRHDWRPHARDLLDGGVEELGRLLERGS